MKNINYKLILLLVLVTVIGMTSGLVGALLARAYLIKETFNFPLFNEVSITGNQLGSSNLIIREPKKVVVEQNVKIQETISSSRNSIVGIYKKNNSALASEQNKAVGIDDYYLNTDQLGQGFILTTDGWLITNFVSTEIKNLLGKKGDNTKALKELLSKNYLVVANDKKTYEIDNLIYDKLTGFSFWHIKASSLPVKQFASYNEIINGQQVVAVNNQGWGQPITIIGYKQGDTVESSDGYIDELVLNDVLNKNFNGSFLVNLNGNLAALINSEGKSISSQSFINSFNSILKDQTITRPSLGLYYLPLNKLVNYSDSKGAVIHKNKNGVVFADNSPAKRAGLKEGDIIIAINNIEIDENNPLNKIISNYQTGTEIEVKYIADQTTKTIKLKLATFVY